MFKRLLNQKDEPAEAAPPARTGPGPESAQPEAPAEDTADLTMENNQTMQNAKNILSNDVEIKGSITFENELTIDGKIEGEITSEGDLTIGENAEIDGEIKTRSVVVLGKVNGNITVNERCELKSKAQLIGDLKAARLVIEEGATFVGKSEVTPNKVNMPRPEVFSDAGKEKSKPEEKITSFGS